MAQKKLPGWRELVVIRVWAHEKSLRPPAGDARLGPDRTHCYCLGSGSSASTPTRDSTPGMWGTCICTAVPDYMKNMQEAIPRPISEERIRIEKYRMYWWTKFKAKFDKREARCKEARE
ncbi:hypothetical protein F444_02199 [Phytophthora nicotianae P1976]|uniref:Uncharacterized protein n=3 Tax=Phytophthora nicotianae TaxID=4792 RepID=A0A081AY89_PHYNI|nr:hypothetical protein F444_02199 [Phytophthora nicotianae P1976]